MPLSVSGAEALPEIAEACVGTTTTGTSCTAPGPGTDDCGTGNESCCTSMEVPGGTYWRTYTNDGVTVSGEMDPASVSGFRLDMVPVTVGRFRQYVNYLLSGSGALPVTGSGIHPHLNGGRGLANGGSPGTFETGWDGKDWNGNFPGTASGWLLDLTSCGQLSAWTMTGGSHESLPLNCASWYEAYAFCIWDGGFLPSEGEWELAAAGGNQQREYPWGSTDPGAANQYAIYNCYYPSGTSNCLASDGIENMGPVDTAPLGASLWGQLHMAGDVFNWTLDWFATYADPCVDCAYLNSATARAFRGSDFAAPASALTPPIRNEGAPVSHDIGVGFRCARAP